MVDRKRQHSSLFRNGDRGYTEMGWVWNAEGSKQYFKEVSFLTLE
jgi:hypothetical protein